MYIYTICFCHLRNRKRPIPPLHSLRFDGILLLKRQADHTFFCSGSMPIIFERGSEESLDVSVRSCRNNPHFSPMNGLSLGVSRESFKIGNLCLPLPWSFPSLRHSINFLILIWFQYFLQPLLSILLILVIQYTVILLVYHQFENCDRFLHFCRFSLLSH